MIIQIITSKEPITYARPTLGPTIRMREEDFAEKSLLSEDYRDDSQIPPDDVLSDMEEGSLQGVPLPGVHSPVPKRASYKKLEEENTAKNASLTSVPLTKNSRKTPKSPRKSKRNSGLLAKLFSPSIESRIVEECGGVLDKRTQNILMDLAFGRINKTEALRRARKRAKSKQRVEKVNEMWNAYMANPNHVNENGSGSLEREHSNAESGEVESKLSFGDEPERDGGENLETSTESHTLDGKRLDSLRSLRKVLIEAEENVENVDSEYEYDTEGEEMKSMSKPRVASALKLKNLKNSYDAHAPMDMKKNKGRVRWAVSPDYKSRHVERQSGDLDFPPPLVHVHLFNDESYDRRWAPWMGGEEKQAERQKLNAERREKRRVRQQDKRVWKDGSSMEKCCSVFSGKEGKLLLVLALIILLGLIILGIFLIS